MARPQPTKEPNAQAEASPRVERFGMNAYTSNGSANAFTEPGPLTSTRPDAQLLRTIESEIIPALMVAHSRFPDAELQRHQVAEGEAPTSDEIAEFARLTITMTPTGLRAYVDTILARGVTLERVFMELLAPAARLLGEMWLADVCTFTDVTIGLSRLQRVLRELGPAFQAEDPHAGFSPRAVFSPAPSENHTFGLHMVAEFFRRDDWEVLITDGSSFETVETVRCEWISVVGFSMSNDSLIERLRQVVHAVREASLNPSVLILVGGSTFLEHPGHTRRVGADAMAVDARSAVRIARAHVQVAQSSPR